MKSRGVGAKTEMVQCIEPVAVMRSAVVMVVALRRTYGAGLLGDVSTQRL